MTPAFASEPQGHCSCGRSVAIERHAGVVLPWTTRKIEDQMLTLFLAPAVIDHRVEDGPMQRIEVPAGATVLSMRGRTETVRSRGSIDVLALSLPQAIFRRMTGSDTIELEASSGSLDPRLQRLMLTIEEERSLGFPAGELFLDAACDALAALLLSSRIAPTPNCGKLASRPMRRVRDAIIEHIDEPMGLAALAGLIGVSTTTLSREFRRSFGVSPHRYALEQRIERCKTLLRHNENTVTDVALATGFQTPQHMATVFKKLTGKTPSEFRAGWRS